MRDEQNPSTAGYSPGQNSSQIGARVLINAGKWFIYYQVRAWYRQSASKTNALLLSARELVRIRIYAVGETDFIKQTRRFFPPMRTVFTGHPETELNVFQSSQVRKEIPILGGDRNASDVGGNERHVLTV
jgi:hypothetical protein